MLLFVSRISLAQQPGEPMSPQELSEFLGTASLKAITWTKFKGPDFDVYYGHANPPLAGDVGFYLRGWPDFTAEKDWEVIPDKLGIFALEWHRHIASDGSVKQEALIRLDDYWKTHIWISAPHQADVDRLLQVVAQLPTFTKKPKPEPPGDET